MAANNAPGELATRPGTGGNVGAGDMGARSQISTCERVAQAPNFRELSTAIDALLLAEDYHLGMARLHSDQAAWHHARLAEVRAERGQLEKIAFGQGQP